MVTDVVSLDVLNLAAIFILVVSIVVYVVRYRSLSDEAKRQDKPLPSMTWLPFLVVLLIALFFRLASHR